MAGFNLGKRRVFILLTAVGLIILFMNFHMLSATEIKSKIEDLNVPFMGKLNPKKGYEPILDQHPIASLMRQADEAWAAYEESRSTSFKETVSKYRRKYGRNPPPGFRDWYIFARDNGVHNVDDFEQIMDDLRPFWGVEPKVIRTLAAQMSATEGDGVSGIHIRNKKIWKLTNNNWRADTFVKMLAKFVRFLPDMDIAMNRLDQPRLVVPWDDMQQLLAKEVASRRVLLDATADWTLNMTGFYRENMPVAINPGWFNRPGEQYMLLAKEACPHGSHARNINSSAASAESLYKDPVGGLITNFNRSSDLCTVGPEIQEKHGFLFASSTVVASRQLLPIFGECKVNVNSDILFPANMYYAKDVRYEYDATYDVKWEDKGNSMIWRGVTSGGTNTPDNWKEMHRQRLVSISNATHMADKEVRILTQDPSRPGVYESLEHFKPSEFAQNHTDVGFTEPASCFPNCDFYQGVWTYKSMAPLGAQFKNKFVVDVDGHSFSGRWRAFLQSKSLGIKSTIFREWHDSRLFAWRHFVPMDNRYDDLYSILTYFVGLGNNQTTPYVQAHEYEGRKLANQGREWVSKVLREEDLEIYTYRLLIEYARIIDDNRGRIGYSGDGSELDKYDSKHR